MVISKEVKIKIGNLNYKYYKNLGYIFNGVGDDVVISIDHLTTGSKCIVEVSCDYCGDILSIPYKRYNNSISISNTYACSKKECSNQKIRSVCMIKYGVANPFQTEFVKKKTKNTLNKKYGVNHPMYLQETKDKIKNTCLDRYGVDNYTKTKEYSIKTKSTNRKKYGVDHHAQTEHGQIQRKLTRIERGYQIPDELLSEFFLYRRTVDNLTSLLKRLILENWDGYDYYDGEYIRDNFTLPPAHRDYPHFDHKISVFYGFKNKIYPDEIARIDNICITKQWINCTKGYQCKNPLD